jgi:hypothetical protein
MKKIQIILLEIINAKLFCCILLICMCVVNAFSQTEEAVIRQQFETYANNNYQEKVFLHTDKTVYASGEILWFKTYVTDANTNCFSFLSKICYVEIIGADKKPLLQGKIDVDSGRGNGSFLIPSSIRTGNYLIRAYTNWMKNFAPENYFEQTITIINPNKRIEVDNAGSVPEVSIQFFPEGGNLVYGLSNNIAFKITNAYGKGLAANGFIINEKNDTITSFQTEKFGMGSFSFTPVNGNKYHAVVTVNNKSFNSALPDIYNKGWVMHIADNGNSLLVNVSCDIESEHNVFLFIQNHDSIKLATVQSLKDGATNFALNKSDLGEGISRLTIFNEKRQPVCERLYFKRPDKILQIKMNDIHQEYNQRSPVNINIRTSLTNGDSISADMSVSVYLTDSLQPEQKLNLLSYLWLASEIRGNIESPGYYFDSSGDEVAKTTDNLILTQGWRRFKWENVLTKTAPSFTFLPELEGHIITGKIFPKVQGMQDTGISVYLSVPGKDFKFSNCISSSSGIRFNVEKFYGDRQLIVQTNFADSNYRLIIDNPFSEMFSSYTTKPLYLDAKFSNEILLRSIGAQAQDIYQSPKQSLFTLPRSFDSTAFYGVPSKRYYLDAYTRFPTMEEVIKEYVKEVHLKKRDKHFYFEVLNEPSLDFFDKEPLVLMDGVPVFDDDKLIATDPLKINKIDVTTNRLYRGDNQYDGIVSFATYSGDLTGFELNPNALVVEYNGLQYEREFYSPQYKIPEEADGRLPDYRNVLYWSPDVQTKTGEKPISFYTSDIPGKYVVVIQGVSSSGVTGFATSDFTVLPDNK